MHGIAWNHMIHCMEPYGDKCETLRGTHTDHVKSKVQHRKNEACCFKLISFVIGRLQLVSICIPFLCLLWTTGEVPEATDESGLWTGGCSGWVGCQHVSEWHCGELDHKLRRPQNQVEGPQETLPANGLCMYIYNSCRYNICHTICTQEYSSTLKQHGSIRCFIRNLLPEFFKLKSKTNSSGWI